ncbi:MAG: hypothetical protein LBR34_10855 [Prevotella sp.]|jgi:hypothetical protein|nr:hypothetical protein [Prevotella sp.]
MKRLTTFALLSVLLMAFGIQSAFAGPFGIEMGMSLTQVKAVCKTTPKHIQDNVYEITPPKTNDMFGTYYVRIDPDYGVYWLKAIGKDIYTNGYGDRVKSTFESLVESIRKTYGKELYIKDELKEGSIWGEPKVFMYALKNGDREIFAMWSKFDENSGIFILNSLLKDPEYKDRVVDYIAASDTTALKDLVIEQYKQLPDDISMISVRAKAESSTKGYVTLEYSFSNNAAVEAKADSVF